MIRFNEEFEDYLAIRLSAVKHRKCCYREVLRIYNEFRQLARDFESYEV